MGSTSVVAAPNGARRARTLYKPWGEVRYQSGTLPTEYTFTGQYSHVDDFGLLYYNARWYDPALGRFVQADTMVPGAGNPSAWDRYAYTQNNPLRYTDPSGHRLECSVLGEIKCGNPHFKKPPSMPWKNDDDYDPDTDSLPDWGTDKSEAWRQERAAKVWRWICQSGGWWGSRCPNAMELSAWLLENEIGILLNNDYLIVNGEDEINKALKLAVTYMKYLFTDDDHITKTDLSLFTAFFNPYYEPSGSFNARDWAKLMRRPHSVAIQTVAAYWKYSYPYPGRDLVWRKPGERNGPSYNQFLFNIISPGTGNATLEFGLR